MGLYTGKGDGGITKIIDTKERISKASPITEALGNLDELSSYLGVIKTNPVSVNYKLQTANFYEILEEIQQNIFTVSANLAGAEKSLGLDKVTESEAYISEVEKEKPPITTFTIVGGTEFAAMLDFARTLARRAERRVVEVSSEREVPIDTLKYLNRLSSLLFALARLTNHRSGIKETAPSYN
jgi:cob(I)alamin adenosyltransferase